VAAVLPAAVAPTPAAADVHLHTDSL
jgi:hypothetical protein